jgi:hypothetical protein
MDGLTEAFAKASFLAVWAMIVLIYSGFIWAAVDTLQAHVALGMPDLPYKQCAGLGLLLAFLANTFNGVVDRQANEILANLDERFFGIDFSAELERRRSRGRERRRERRFKAAARRSNARSKQRPTR